MLHGIAFNLSVNIIYFFPIYFLKLSIFALMHKQ